VRLAAAAEQAAQIRALTTRPAVIALQVDRVRLQVDVLLWLGVGLGLVFTMVNVQQFAAAGAPAFSPTWWTAWLLDPMVSLVLIAVMRAEQITARYGVPLGVWARRTKWCAFAVTYTMNTWVAWGLDSAPFSVSGVVLHSIPPLLVVLAAETGPGLRDRLTAAADRAHHSGGGTTGPITNTSTSTFTATTSGHEAAGPPVPEPPSNLVHEPLTELVHEPAGGSVQEPPREQAREPRRRIGGPTTDGAPRRRRSSKQHRPPPRRLLADYLTVAQAALDEAVAAGRRPLVTPTWCRDVTGCSAGTSVKLAAALRTKEPA
jgi:hypothetical protein